MKYLLIAMFSGIMLIGCEIKKDYYDTSNPILNLAYSEDYYYPDDFYYETIDSGSTYYVNTISVKPLDERDHIRIDLCTNDIDEARYWVEASISNSSVNRILVSERQTDKYFEFKSVNPLNKNDIILFRVHKNSYFIPLMDKFKIIDTIGQIPGSASQTVNVKQLIEYLWSTGVLGYPTKVYEANFQDTTLGFKYKIKSISIVYGDFNLYDIISLHENTFIINSQNGIITWDRQLLEEINGIHR